MNTSATALLGLLVKLSLTCYICYQIAEHIAHGYERVGHALSVLAR